MRKIALATLLWTGTPSRALAQGMYDWGIWFGTLVVIAAVAVLVGVLITLVRWLKR
jgi:hypothetical protein